MEVTSASLTELYQIVGCINSILNRSVVDNSLVFQSRFNYFLDYPVIRRDYERQFDFPQPSNYDFYVIYLGDLSIETFLGSLKKHENFNPRAGYIFIGEKPDPSFVSALLTEFIWNFVVLSMKTGEIFTVFPYQSARLDNLSIELQQIGSCGESFLDLPHSIFPNKIPPVWKRSKLTLIYTYEAPYSMVPTGLKRGIEIDLLQLIFERLGFEGDYVNKNDEFLYAAFLLASQGKYDIKLGNLALKMAPSIDSTVPYTCDSTFWYVSQPKSIPKWKLALSVFSLEVAVTWFLSTFILCLLWESTQVLTENKRLGDRFFDKVWRIISILLEQSVKVKIDYATPGILVFLMLQTFLVLNSMYKAKYTFYLSGINFEKTIETLDEIMEKGLKVGSTKFLIGAYKTTPIVQDYLQENFVECDTGTTCLNRSALDRDLAVLKPYRKVAYIRDRFTDQYGNFQHHRLKSPVFTICNTFRLPKGHPMYRLIDRYVYLTEQHGFVQKIISDYDDKMRMGQKSIAIRNPRLQFDAVKGPIYLVAIGSLLAIAVFVIENMINARIGRNWESKWLWLN